MRFECKGRRYRATRASTLEPETFCLEIDDVTGPEPTLVISIAYHETTGDLTFSAFAQDLPLELVEWAIGGVRDKLTPTDRPA